MKLNYKIFFSIYLEFIKPPNAPQSTTIAYMCQEIYAKAPFRRHLPSSHDLKESNSAPFAKFPSLFCFMPEPTQIFKGVMASREGSMQAHP
jgi:hypothetical protein